MTPNLFVNAKSEFLHVTGQRYDAMRVRIKKQGLPPLNFDKDQFRAHVLEAMGNDYNGVIQCRYCNAHFTVSQVGVDHAVPLGRGGSTDLHNLEYPCKPCNSRKGKLTPTEYLALLNFLEKNIPLGRIDILNRLEIAVQLVTNVRAQASIVGSLKKTGHWKAAQAEIRARKKP